MKVGGGEGGDWRKEERRNFNKGSERRGERKGSPPAVYVPGRPDGEGGVMVASCTGGWIEGEELERKEGGWEVGRTTKYLEHFINIFEAIHGNICPSFQKFRGFLVEHRKMKHINIYIPIFTPRCEQREMID